MKRILIYVYVAFILLSSFSLVAADVMGLNWQTWSVGTTELLPPRRVEVGVFQPLRYGFSDKLEFSVHPLLFFVMPNFDVKWAHGEMGGFKIASVHGITYPSLLMKLMAKEGIGGFISPEFDIPHIFSFQNDLLASRQVFGKHLVTVKLAFNFAFKSGPLDSDTTIDLPVVYIRSGVYYHDYGFRLGADLKGPLSGRWSYVVDSDFFYYPTADSDINSAFEHKGLVYWNKSGSFQLCFGYLLSYCEYPFGTQWHLLPLVDLQWGWTR